MALLSWRTGAALIGAAPQAKARDENENDITDGDIAILRFLAAAEIIETDLWQQYAELGGVDAANSGYVAALEILDGDQPGCLVRCETYRG